jgi:ABC-2 type transport system permease protein
MRAALLDGAGFGELLPTILLLLATGLLLIPVGMLIFSKAEHYAKKKGKLKRSG